MKWSLKLGEVAGIAIYVHWTFSLLIVWILLSSLSSGQTLGGALTSLAFVLTIFLCVVLHELGHALTARRFGIGTRDITLLPIGGVARLERIPDRPLQELLVALAGPAVNVVIAVVLLGILLASGTLQEAAQPLGAGWRIGEGTFLTNLLYVNAGLEAFNMLPAFPMDGGRVLRAMLSPVVGHVSATKVAATVGQFIAILFGALGLFGNPMLLFIALFIFLGAQQESQMAHVNAILHGVPVRDAMMTRFRTLSADDPIETAIQELLAGAQQDFPVVHDSQVLGMLRREDLLGMLAEPRPPRRVGEVMRPGCTVVEDHEMLQRVFEQMHNDDCSSLPVVASGRLVGLVSLENVGEWLMIHAARSRRASR